jgi:hypothetical protein
MKVFYFILCVCVFSAPFLGLGLLTGDEMSYVNQASAQESLVPTGRDGDYNPDGYGSCELVETVNNVIAFLMQMTALIAVFVFMYAGFIMVSARGDSTLIEGAKKLFANVLIGFVILLTAFLVINTIVGILVGGASGGLTWQSIECQYAYESKDADAVAVELDSYEGYVPEAYVNSYTPVVIGDMPTARPGSGSGACLSSGLVIGDSCYAPNRCQVRSVSGACPRIGTYNSYINAAAAKYGVPASRIRGVMITESGGDPNARSPVGALGLMQIMPATGRASCGLSAADLLVPSKNIDCGAKYYAQQYQLFGSHDLAAAAYNAGPGRNSPSSDCPGLRQWQCPFNSGGCCPSGSVTGTSCALNTGFNETRKYVDKVNAASPACRN